MTASVDSTPHYAFPREAETHLGAGRRRSDGDRGKASAVKPTSSRRRPGSRHTGRIVWGKPFAKSLLPQGVPA